MTVVELIAALQKMPPDIHVMMRDHEGTNELFDFDGVQSIEARRVTFHNPVLKESIVSYHEASRYKPDGYADTIETVVVAVFT